MATGQVVDASWAGSQPLVTMECPTCGVHYALAHSFQIERRANGKTWWCPNGCSLHYPQTESLQQRELRETKAALDRAKADADDARRQRNWAQTAARGANIAAGKAKAARLRLEQRVAHGVCPCCHRTFKQLAAHMKTKHPGTAMK